MRFAHYLEANVAQEMDMTDVLVVIGVGGIGQAQGFDSARLAPGRRRRPALRRPLRRLDFPKIPVV